MAEGNPSLAPFTCSLHHGNAQAPRLQPLEAVREEGRREGAVHDGTGEEAGERRGGVHDVQRQVISRCEEAEEAELHLRGGGAGSQGGKGGRGGGVFDEYQKPGFIYPVRTC